MPDRKSLVYTLWPTFPLAFLAWALASPVSSAGIDALGTRSDRSQSQSTLHRSVFTPRIIAATSTEEVPEVEALAPDVEEQDRVNALSEPRASERLTRFYLSVLDRQSISLPSILSHYPLRC